VANEHLISRTSTCLLGGLLLFRCIRFQLCHQVGSCVLRLLLTEAKISQSCKTSKCTRLRLMVPLARRFRDRVQRFVYAKTSARRNERTTLRADYIGGRQQPTPLPPRASGLC
jgi:hypothetical protein